MAAETDKVEPADSEQDEEEDVYEVERIIDMRVEEGEVLYRVRWKNYCSDDDTWEPEAHLEDCREVLLAFKKSLAEAKAKKEAEAKKSVKLLPTKSDVFDADSESDSDKDRPTEAPIKKKKKKKIREEDDELLSKDKKKKKKEKRKEEVRPLPAPETDEEDEEEERAPTPPSPVKEKKTETKKRVVDSDEEDDEPVPSKKHRKEKGKEGGKHKKEKGEDGKKKKGKRERKVETSDDEATAPLEEYMSDGPSESQLDDTTSSETLTKSADKARAESKQRKGKWEVKLQGIKDLIHDKKSKKTDAAQKESSLQKLKSLTSKSKEENAPHSDSSDSSTLHKKGKSKGQESAAAAAAAKVPSSSASSSSSSSVTATGSTKVKDEEVVVMKEEVLGQKDAAGSTNLFEKFLLNCEAKDRAPRRQPVHQAPVEKPNSKPTKLIGRIEKIPKTTKESPAQKTEPEKTDKTKQSDVSKPGGSYGFTLDSDEKEGEESAAKPRVGEESSRERRERPEEAQRPSWERRTPTDDRRRRREDSEPRLFMACDDNQDNQEPAEGADKSDRGQATLSLGMDLNLDWMSLDDFQKHLNGEDEILSGPPLSPSELRDAVKSGDYMAVKLALNSKEDYNLDQEAVVTKVVLRDDERCDDKARVVHLERLLARRTAELAAEKHRVAPLLADKDAEIARLKADLKALRADTDSLRQENQRLRESSHSETQRGELAIMEEVRAGFGELQAALQKQRSQGNVSAAPERPTPRRTASSAGSSTSEARVSPSALEDRVETPRQHSDVSLRAIGPKDCARLRHQSYGQVGRFGCLLFRKVISEENYKAWSRTTNWDGSRGKHELPQNVKKFVVKTLRRNFPAMKKRELRDCINKINEFLRTTRKCPQGLTLL